MERRSGLLLAVAVLVALAAVPAPVAADETRSGSTVIVEEDETVGEDLTVFGGTLIVRGTVEGDLTAFTGNVFIDGRVNGNVDAFSGNVRVNGTVTGDVRGFGGNVALAESGRIGGQFEAAGGNVVLDGEVGGDARLGAGTISVGPNAVVGGDLAYDGDLALADGARIEGQVTQSDDAGIEVGGPAVSNWVGWVYGLLVNLLLGAVLLTVLPGFSREVTRRATDAPLRSAGVGLLLFVAIPVLLILLLVTIVGIPLSLSGAVVYALLLWVGTVYGMYAVGVWGLSLADADNRWLALVVGVVAVSLVGLIPLLGGLVQFAVLLLGFGALALSVRARYRGRRTARRGAATGVGGPETASGGSKGSESTR